MYDLKYRLYCYLHYIAKKILRRTNLSTCNFWGSPSISLGINSKDAITLWKKFINNSVITSGEFHDMCYGGYIAEKKEWCLPSWIWTNAAIVRECCFADTLAKISSLVSLLEDKQVRCGGWIVRNDYDKRGPIPMLAPNDSAYIANNAFLSLYRKTNDKKYLEIACRCADWIIETSRPDGLVYVGYNMRDKKWDKDCVIVDVGFTGGLFASLVELTNEEKYNSFLKHFIYRYIELFHIPGKHGFCTSIDKTNRQQGGMFGRGQAWALEGLIPAYTVLKDNRIKHIINDTVEHLMQVQLKNGAWPYNLTNPLMGEDCKAVSVIAKNMMEWYKITKNEHIKQSAYKALQWCYKHTSVTGEAAGGIFSFCMEGAIVQNLYSSCAFVYSSVYAIELHNMLMHEYNYTDISTK